MEKKKPQFYSSLNEPPEGPKVKRCSLKFYDDAEDDTEWIFAALKQNTTASEFRWKLFQEDIESRLTVLTQSSALSTAHKPTHRPSSTHSIHNLDVI